jgi:hypothetical protein
MHNCKPLQRKVEVQIALLVWGMLLILYIVFQEIEEIGTFLNVFSGGRWHYKEDTTFFKT